MSRRIEKQAASFRDPSGFLFHRDGVLYRQVNHSYQPHYLHLIDSGLYEDLTKSGLLISHQEVALDSVNDEKCFKVLQPEIVPFVSYPYEWSFSQLKDAARVTLAIQKRAMKYGMMLKDASAYNIQFLHGRPVLIDTLSFEIYLEGSPWIAYRQFCQHFLAPLALMAFCDVRLGQLLRVQLDGIPLGLASRLLPSRTRLNFGLLSHIHLHAVSEQRYKGRKVAAGSKISKTSLLTLIDHLEATLGRLTWKMEQTQWRDYYAITNYSETARSGKEKIIGDWLDQVQSRTVWDLGANTGVFSRLACRRGMLTMAFDIDPAAVEMNYLQARQDGEKKLLPLIVDLANPSPGLGWANRERDSLASRGPTDLVLALALIHHLVITNNVPLDQAAAFLAELGGWLVIEFVPKTDSQIQVMLANRQDIFSDYDQPGFESAFASYFYLRSSISITDTERILYLMERR